MFNEANLPLVHLFWAQTGNVWMLLVGAWALWRGGRIERAGAAIFGLSWGLSMLIFPSRGISPYLVANDVALCLAFTVLAVKSRRLWVFLFAASLLNLVAAHVMAYVGHLGKYAYVTALGIWGGYVPLIILTVAMTMTERRRGRSMAETQTVID